MLIVSGSFRNEKVLHWRAFRRDTRLVNFFFFFGLANGHCPVLLLPASPAFCLLSIPSTRQPPLCSAVVKSAVETRHGQFFSLCATAEPQPAWLFSCIQPSLQWEQEIPEVIHAAYCFLSRSQRRFHRLAPTLPFSWSWIYRLVSFSPLLVKKKPSMLSSSPQNSFHDLCN